MLRRTVQIGIAVAGLCLALWTARPKDIVGEAMSVPPEAVASISHAAGSHPTTSSRALRAGSARAPIADRVRDRHSPVAQPSVLARLHDISGAAGSGASSASDVNPEAMAAWALQQVASGNSPRAPEHLEAPDRASPASPSIGETPSFGALNDRWTVEADAPPDAVGSESTMKYLLETARAVDLHDDTVSSAECRATVCRAELQFPTLKDAAAFEAGAQRPDLDYAFKNKPSDHGIAIEVLLDKRARK